MLPCGCCEGVGVVTPLSVASRPGLAALRYRVGTHAAFLDTMLARLSSSEFPALRGSSTRDPSDFSIALLDGWATIADVLTFYQERIANEGYLHTATEARSVLELARLVGYELRPGVAASVYLAYTLDDGHDVVIPVGSRVQSVPGPGELPQPFETSEPLNAHAALNVLRPRLTRPQVITRETRKVWFGGIATGLQKGDGLLVDLGDGDNRFFERVAAVDIDHEAQRTVVTLGTEDADEPGPAPIALRDLVARAGDVGARTAAPAPREGGRRAARVPEHRGGRRPVPAPALELPARSRPRADEGGGERPGHGAAGGARLRDADEGLGVRAQRAAQGHPSHQRRTHVPGVDVLRARADHRSRRHRQSRRELRQGAPEQLGGHRLQRGRP